jgi:hypothetical protein
MYTEQRPNRHCNGKSFERKEFNVMDHLTFIPYEKKKNRISFIYIHIFFFFYSTYKKNISYTKKKLLLLNSYIFPSPPLFLSLFLSRQFTFLYRNIYVSFFFSLLFFFFQLIAHFSLFSLFFLLLFNFINNKVIIFISTWYLIRENRRSIEKC